MSRKAEERAKRGENHQNARAMTLFTKTKNLWTTRPKAVNVRSMISIVADAAHALSFSYKYDPLRGVFNAPGLPNRDSQDWFTTRYYFTVILVWTRNYAWTQLLTFPEEHGAFCKNASVLHELWRFQANFATLQCATHLCFMNLCSLLSTFHELMHLLSYRSAWFPVSSFIFYISSFPPEIGAHQTQLNCHFMNLCNFPSTFH